ncbi:bifunctional 5,10-methylenetetrahydrofolate dehydrogenase/5,10-methenyltetrahydrofolate cyclohydrolase [Acuticoccus sp.]|uniref:bifunctional 5,10-methylenetetrahydrofolate dehydrogenase/5,10-methenyltetrahydrofolate cyclohydrolase n=1 Tax=Acuticoccus sp. TaxID=1904378 RepID=UPI003B52A0C2
MPTADAPGPRLIDGKAAAARITDEVARRAARLPVRPGLAVVIVGEDPASVVYVRMKSATAEALGFHSVQHTLPAETTQAELVALVAALNADPAVHGILVQLPLPAHLDPPATIAAIDPDKDVDGLTVANAGRLAVGDPRAIVPCTPLGCLALIEAERGADLSGLDAVVVGRSRLVGLPMALLLAKANATVTIAHSRTADVAALARRADILVAAAGRPRVIDGAAIKPGATVIDVGTNRVADASRASGSRLVGDVAFEEATAASAITPVPGGVGPMTIAMLMRNTLEAAERSVQPASTAS